MEKGLSLPRITEFRCGDYRHCERIWRGAPPFMRCLQHHQPQVDNPGTKKLSYLYTIPISHCLMAACGSTYSPWHVHDSVASKSKWESSANVAGAGSCDWDGSALKWEGQEDIDLAALVSALNKAVILFWKFIRICSLVLWIWLIVHNFILLMKLFKIWWSNHWKTSILQISMMRCSTCRAIS